MEYHKAFDVRIESNNALGYHVFSDYLYQAISSLGAIENDDAKVSLNICPPKAYVRVEGKTNILFTMCETDYFNDAYKAGVAQADVVVVPSRFCADIFRQYTSVPIHIVPLGVDTKAFSFVDRPRKPRPFQFLWIGAANERKGHPVVSQVWTSGFDRLPDVQLYIKTWSNGRDDLVQRGNVTVDSRMLPTSEIVSLYHNSHVLLFPTGGEGWGQPLAEAMATGMPCITTRYSSVLEFTNSETVKYLDYEMLDGESTEHEYLGKFAYPNPMQLATAMSTFLVHYNRALKMGRQAHRKIQRFTWDRTGQELLSVMKKYA